MNESDSATIANMIGRGGYFDHKLGVALQFATTDQLAAIKHALPEVFEKYRPPGIATPGPVEARVNS